MSFILDALRKSDQQRQRGMSPPPMIAPVPPASPRQPAIFWYALIAVALIGAGALLGAMSRRHAESESAVHDTPAPASASNVAAASDGGPAVSAAPPLPPPSMPAEKSKKENALLSPPVAAQTSGAAPVPALAAISAPAAVSVEAGQGTAAGAAIAATAADLPSSLQQEVPQPAILIHSYSATPASRFVFIGDRKWREGESPAPGLRLEQITADGAIFNYKGYRFRRGINP